MGVDYKGDKKKYGKLDTILNPENKFTKPTLEQIRLHKKEYLKQAKKISPKFKKINDTNSLA